MCDGFRARAERPNLLRCTTIYIVGGELQSTFDTAVLLLYFISASSRTVKTTALYIQKYDISTEYDVRSALESAAHRLTLLYIVLQVRQAGSSMQHVVWICVCVCSVYDTRRCVVWA